MAAVRALRAVLRRLLHRLEPKPRRVQAPDQIGEHLRAAVAADARAKAANAETYEARVNAMISDFFSKLEDRDARHHP